MTLVLFMLCSGLFQITGATNHLRFFNVISGMSITEARNECEKMGGALATLYDQQDINFTKWVIRESFQNPLALETFFIGLRRNRPNVTTWSNGVAYTYNFSSVNISELKKGEQICEAIENNTWKGFNCSDTKPFMCYKGNTYTLIKEEKNWCEAQWHCRRHYDDLVSISNMAQNQQVIKEGQNKTFWIGLLHDEWQWDDGSCSTYRNWNRTLVSDGGCAVVQFGNLNGIDQFNCDNDKQALCTKGRVRIRLINEPRTWEQALDFCKINHSGMLEIEDSEDQEAAEQQLENILTEVNVTGPLWIGLRQSSVFGFWIWSDRIASFSNWKDDKQPEMPLSFQCGVIDTKMNYTWRDADCWLRLPFLCEHEINS